MTGLPAAEGDDRPHPDATSVLSVLDTGRTKARVQATLTPVTLPILPGPDPGLLVVPLRLTADRKTTSDTLRIARPRG